MKNYKLYDAWKFTDGNNDDWLAVIIPGKNQKKVFRDQNGVCYKLNIITKKANTGYFGNPTFLGNVLEDKKLAKKLNVKITIQPGA
jgi:hypothetical protein